MVFIDPYFVRSQVSNTKNFTSSFLKVLNGHSVRLANAEEEARRGRDPIQMIILFLLEKNSPDSISIF